MAQGISTRLTKLLGIRHPVLLPGMSWISTPPLVAAVSNAGGLGILATGPLSAEETRASIREIRERTSKPFGIGTTLMMPGAEANARVALEEKVPVINFSLGKADWIVEGAHAYGGKVIATVATEKHARSAEAIGADALLVTGHEAAAHGGDVTSLVLVPCIASRVRIPIIAAGGFADGRGLMAALSLGADGVAMGSRFATTQESPVSQNVKERIVASSENDTLYSKNFDGMPARVLKTPKTQALLKHPMHPIVAAWKSFSAARDFKIPLWKVIPGLLTQWDKMYLMAMFGGATESFIRASKGDLETGVQFIGQSQGLITDIPHVHELLQRIIVEAAHVQAGHAERFGEASEGGTEQHSTS